MEILELDVTSQATRIQCGQGRKNRI